MFGIFGFHFKESKIKFIKHEWHKLLQFIKNKRVQICAIRD